jgi:hypothetical protein
MFGEKKKRKRQNEEKEKSSGKAKCAGGVCASPYAPRSSFVTSLRLGIQSRMSKFPEIQGGGSLILAWQVKSKHVVVIGGGEVSSYLHLQLYSSTNPKLRSPRGASCMRLTPTPK